MRRRLRLVSLLAVATASNSAIALAQQPERGAISGVVSSPNGTPVSNARVQLRSAGRDTAVRTNDRGFYVIAYPRVSAELTVLMIGYQPARRSVSIEAATTVDVQLTAIPQKLSEVSVRADWIGVRGVVGDDSTMQPLPNVLVRSTKRGISVRTDSLGQFEFSLPKRERVTLQLESEGYLTRPAYVGLDTTNSASVVLLMRHGQDAKHVKQSLVDLGNRLSWGGNRMFVVTRAQLSQQGAQYLGDGLRESGMLARKNMLNNGCLFIDGVPRPGTDFNMVPVTTIDFVEMYEVNADETGTLRSRWPYRGCSPPTRPGAGGPNGPWISVWTRK
ncbi:MAG: carboxypeptidase regulatory-like domain-containing protein [Gemmatimonas sp.]